MTIAGLIGAANQSIVNLTQLSDKGKAETTSNNVSFLSAAKEVAESMAGKIVVGNGAKMEGLNVKKEDFEIDSEIPEGVDTVYDFIAEIRKILKDKKQG
jgi:hypothetical protein